jgi:hypothetical protein
MRGTGEGAREFRNDFHTAPLFDNEAENRFLIKVSYWFPL